MFGVLNKLVRLQLMNFRNLNNHITKATFEAIWDWDLLAETIHWGEGFQSIFGYDLNTITSDISSWADHIHLDDVDRILEEIHQLIDGTEVHWAGEYRYLKSDQTYAYVADKCYVIRDEQGKATRLVGALKDITERKNDEIALQQSEARLRGIISSQTNYVIRTDLDGNYSYYNQKFIDDFGWLYNQPSILGLSGMLSIKEYHHQRLLDTVKKCLASANEVFQIEIDKPARDGGVKSTFWDFICLTDSFGQPVEIQCVGIDISDKKKAEQAYIATLEEKNVILESIGDAFFAVDKKWVVSYWNQQAEKSTGIPKCNIIGQYFWDIFSETIDSGFFRKYHEAINTNQVVFFEEFHPSLAKWFEVSAYPSDSGLSVYFKDVTERKQYEIALKLREQRFKSLVHEGSDLINILDEHGCYKYLSPAYHTVLGIELGELIGTKALDRIHEEDRERVDQTSARLLTEKRVKYLPFRYRIKTDQYRWLETIATNLVDDPAIEGILINSKDITDQINYIQAIEEQNTKLREIAWMQSHLVRAPLSRIMGLVNLLSNKAISDEMSPELLKDLLVSADELDGIVRDIVKNTVQIKSLKD